VTCVFFVVVDKDGSSRVVLSPDERFTSERMATAKDVYPALANVLADFQGLKTAEALVSFQMAAARQQAAQAQAASQEPPSAP
jgi:ubiquinone biosynthesis protein Coq4